MKPIKTARHSGILCMGALLWFFPIGASLAQVEASPIMNRSSSAPGTVSKNQLLAPSAAVRAVDRARKDIQEGHLESAEKEIAQALHVAPHFAVAWALKGAIDLDRQHYDEATTFFQQALEDDPALGAAYVGMALTLIRQGRYQAALPLLDRAEGLLSGSWFVHYAEGWAQLGSGNIDAAVRQADRAERIAGVDPEKRSGVSYLRGMVSIHTNDLASARLHLADAIALDPSGGYASLAQRKLESLQPPLQESHDTPQICIRR
jgi:tetratricopeptide (TPR) repeat protein